MKSNETKQNWMKVRRIEQNEMNKENHIKSINFLLNMKFCTASIYNDKSKCKTSASP